MKPSSKRKRTKNELEEVKEEEKLLNEDKGQFLQAVKRMRQDYQVADAQRVEYQNDHEVVGNLLRLGKIDVFGNP